MKQIQRILFRDLGNKFNLTSKSLNDIIEASTQDAKRYRGIYIQYFVFDKVGMFYTFNRFQG